MTALDIVLILLILCVVAMLCVVIFAPTDAFGKKRNEHFTAPYEQSLEGARMDRLKWKDDSIAYPAKCIDCERVFPVGERWRGQQTKCFSCESQSHIHPQRTHPQKTFV